MVIFLAWWKILIKIFYFFFLIFVLLFLLLQIYSACLSCHVIFLISPLAGWWFQKLTCISQGQLEHSQINYVKAFLLFITVILILKCPCKRLNWWAFSGSGSMSSTSRGVKSSAGSGSVYPASFGNFGLLLACCRSEKHFAC